MTKTRIGYKNAVLDLAASAIAVSSASLVGGYGKENLLNDERGSVCRTGIATTDQTIVITLPVAALVYQVTLVNARKHTGGALKCETKNGGGAYSNFAGGTGLFAEPSPNRTRQATLCNPSGILTTDIKVTFVNTGSVNEDVEVGVIYVATTDGFFSATVNVTDDYKYDPVDPSEKVRSEGGQKLAFQKSKYLAIENSFSFVARAQEDALLAIHDEAGLSQQVVYAVNPENQNEMFYGTFERFNTTHLTRDQWRVDLRFEEAV